MTELDFFEYLESCGVGWTYRTEPASNDDMDFITSRSSKSEEPQNDVACSKAKFFSLGDISGDLTKSCILLRLSGGRMDIIPASK